MERVVDLVVPIGAVLVICFSLGSIFYGRGPPPPQVLKAYRKDIPRALPKSSPATPARVYRVPDERSSHEPPRPLDDKATVRPRDLAPEFKKRTYSVVSEDLSKKVKAALA